jgi:hypothetical protein
VLAGTEKQNTGADRFQFVASSRALAFLRQEAASPEAAEEDLLSKVKRANAAQQEAANKNLLFPD